MCVLGGVVVALALTIALEPKRGITDNALSVAADATRAAANSLFSPATPTPNPMAAHDDSGRRIDADNITAASFRYYQDHGSYPFGAPGVHALCADKSVDPGCQFEAYLNPVPMDARGDPAQNGYWYESDGLSYTLYMAMESGDGLDESGCPQPRPKELANVAHLYCARIGPPKQ
jgi:hypothetical protein